MGSIESGKQLQNKKLECSRLELYFKESDSKKEFASKYLQYLSEITLNIDESVIENIIDSLLLAWESNNSVYLIGNGGSAAIASHLANDINIGTLLRGSKPFRVISLVDNPAIVTAISNDENYASVFVKQLEGILNQGDVIMAFSVSGNSMNIIKALEYAREKNAVTIVCTGFDGGLAKQIADINLHVPTYKGEYGPAEDVFSIVCHLIYSYLRLSRNRF